MASERGQSSLLVVAILTVVAAIGAAIFGLGLEAVGRARAQAVADLTALAATHGDAEGGAIATANGAAHVVSRHEGDAVTVVVDVAGRRAIATADR
jgi:hypothetical protein